MPQKILSSATQTIIHFALTLDNFLSQFTFSYQMLQTEHCLPQFLGQCHPFESSIFNNAVWLQGPGGVGAG